MTATLANATHQLFEPIIGTQIRQHTVAGLVIDAHACWPAPRRQMTP